MTDRARLRRAIAVALLVVLAGSLASGLRKKDLGERWRLLARAVSGERVAAGSAMGFWFDPNYATFLEAVRLRTPRNATVAVFAPIWPDLYRYQAVYQLAPRRIVDRKWESEASYLAAYSGEAPGARDAVEIPYGTLARR